RRALHRELIDSARAAFPQMLATEIPNWSEIERMTVRRAPLAAVAPHSAAAALYGELWREICARTAAPEPPPPAGPALAEELQPQSPPP
ncbi:MAG TPA: hypothetical protein VL994_07040, partial [Steroidobacteraceae bacterium]|nr:hypothetical protein [Steroidobacteraceae bacterium]